MKTRHTFIMIFMISTLLRANVEVDKCQEIELSLFKARSELLKSKGKDNENFLSLQAQADRLNAKLAIYRGLSVIKKESDKESYKLFEDGKLDQAITNFKTEKATRQIHIENFIDDLITERQDKTKDPTKELNIVYYKAKLTAKCKKYDIEKKLNDNFEICNQLLKDKKSFKAVENFFNLYSRATLGLTEEEKLVELQSYRDSLSHIETNGRFEDLNLINKMKDHVKAKYFCKKEEKCKEMEQVAIDKIFAEYKKKMVEKLKISSRQDFANFDKKGQKNIDLINKTQKLLIRDKRKTLDKIKIIARDVKVLDKEIEKLTKDHSSEYKRKLFAKTFELRKTNEHIFRMGEKNSTHVPDLIEKRKRIILSLEKMIDKKLISTIQEKQDLLIRKAELANSIKTEYSPKMARNLKTIKENLTLYLDKNEGSKELEGKITNIINKLDTVDLKNNVSLNNLLVKVRQTEKSWRDEVKEELIKNKQQSTFNIDSAIKKLQNSVNALKYGNPNRLREDLEKNALNRLNDIIKNSDDYNKALKDNKSNIKAAEKFKIEGIGELNNDEFLNEAINDFNCKKKNADTSNKKALISCLENVKLDDIDKKIQFYEEEQKNIVEKTKKIRELPNFKKLQHSIAKLETDKKECYQPSVTKIETLEAQPKNPCPPAGTAILGAVEAKPVVEVNKYLAKIWKNDKENLKGPRREYVVESNNREHFRNKIYNKGYTYDKGPEQLKQSNGFLNYLTGATNSFMKYVQPNDPFNLIYLGVGGYQPGIMAMEMRGKNMKNNQYLSNYWYDQNLRTQAAMFTFYNGSSYGTTTTDGSYNWSNTSNPYLVQSNKVKKATLLPLPFS